MKKQFNEKESAFQQVQLQQLDVHRQKKKKEPQPMVNLSKNYLKKIMNFSIKYKTIKLLEKT